MTTVTTRPARPALDSARRLLPARADTPGWIRWLAVLAVLLTAGAALVIATGASSTRHGIDVIGHRTAPTVAATEDLYFALADMDAQLANVLLAGDDSALTRVRDTALAGMEQRRTQVDADLQQAMTIATNDDAAAQIRELLDLFGRYQGQAADTLQLTNLDHGAAGKPSARTLDAYRAATGMVPDLMARAQKLADTNSGVLESAYSDSEHTTTVARLRIAVLGILVLGTLLGLQVLLRVTLRRRINPALVLTTVLAAALVIGGFTANSTAAQQLTTAKKDAFDSLLALRQARALSYDANADESRFLLDPERAGAYQDAFYRKSQRLAGVAANTLDDYVPALDKALSTNGAGLETALAADSFLGKELRNITFSGERTAAQNTLTAYQSYQHDDRALRAQDRTDLRAAISLDTGPSNDHFAAYDQALVATIDINQRAFDSAIADSESALAGWNNWLPLGGAVLISLLVLVGVRPRLAEFR
ncbi:hypothetical protein [Nocardia sp. NBC_01388]|uniref:hypothetical protein n=1 Tax=Nocardia sp. NBC_01388 TaxID=2903596 RepID=UPI00324BB875